MNAILICPGSRPAVALLAESCPLAVAPVLGKCLLEYWIEHLVALGIRDILIAASDRAACVEDHVGDGARWGLPIAVMAEDAELSETQASEKYFPHPAPPPQVVVLMDHLPGGSGTNLLESYSAWFAGLQNWIPLAQELDRIGQCEVQPGVWVGLRARIDPSAQLLAPCWVGDYVRIDGDTVIGPATILEDGVFVAAGAHVARSVIGPATFVGARLRVESSIAHRHTLIDWATSSCLRVPDAFWLSSLDEPQPAARPDAAPGPMRIESEGRRLRVSQVAELSDANAARFRDELFPAVSPQFSAIEVDLSDTRYLDSCGLAALAGLHRRAGALGIGLRLLNPDSSVRQLLEMTQMRQLFEIGHGEAVEQRAAPRRFAPARDLVPAS